MLLPFDVNIFQTIPATIQGGRVAPDFNYAMILDEGAQYKHQIIHLSFFI
jgi:hypothetical protein